MGLRASRPIAWRLRCGAAVAVAWLAAPAAALVDVDLVCPRDTAVGQPTPIQVKFQSSECTPVDVRLSSMIVGAAQDLGSTAIFGPEVALASHTLPAANCTPFPQTTSTTLDIEAPPATPAAYAGKIVTLVVIADWTGGAETDACLVTLPEPALASQRSAGALAVLALTALRRRRSRSARPRSRA